MKTKTIIVCTLALLLIVFATWEQIFISDSLKEISAMANELQTKIVASENVNDDIIAKINKLDKQWEKTEFKFCYILNHNDLKEIGDAICYAKVYARQNSKDSLEEKIAIVSYYADNYLKMYSFNIQNII